MSRDAKATAAAVALDLEIPTPALLETPFALSGTPAEIAQEVRAPRDHWDVTRWVIRETAPDASEAHLPEIQDP